MKVALVVPDKNELLNATCVAYGLGHIAVYLKKHIPEVEVRIIDGMAGHDLNHDLFVFQPDIVGVTASTPQAPEAYEIGDGLHTNRPDIVTVMGGIHASSLPNEAAKHFDHVIVGEGEVAFTELVRTYMNGQVPRRIIQGNPIENLDEIPPIDYLMLDVEEYLKHGVDLPSLKPPVMNMVTSRGCPHRCPFCYNSERKTRVRYFSAERVVQEILFIHEKYGVNTFYFSDDEFLINTKRLREIGRLLRENGALEWITWGCQVRSKTLTIATCKLAKESGCVLASIGIESGNQRMLNYWKNGTTTLADHEQAFRNCEAAGITAGGSFIYGGFDETIEEMKETYKWLTKQPIKFVGTGTIIPYPNTKVWEECQKRNLLPNPVDYHKLIPSYYIEDAYIIDQAVKFKEYRKFMVNTARMARIHARMKYTRSLRDFFFRYPKRAVWWWAWLFHPLQMIRIVAKLIRKKRAEGVIEAK